MFGYRLFRHAVLMLIDNLGPAFKISLPPLVALMAVGFTCVMLTFGGVPSGDVAAPAGFVVMVFLFLIAVFVAFCLVAVSWHRYVLVEEQPGRWGPNWHGPEIGNYVWASIRVAFGSLIFAIPLLIVAVLISGGQFNSNELGVVPFVFNMATTFCTVRLSLALPAAALGERKSIWESWRITAPFFGPIFVAVLLMQVLVTIPVLLLGTYVGGALGSASYFTLAAWLQVMLSISILTALYGYIVEERALR